MNKREQLIEIAKKVTDNEVVAIKYAEHLSELIDAIDPRKIGVDYIAAINAEDYICACTALAAYYRTKPRNTIPELSAVGSYSKALADRTAEGYVEVCGTAWSFENGEFDFLFNATEINGPVTHEWLWQLGRHFYWINLARAYVGTGDEKYAIAFERQLLKWIAQTYIPDKWNAPGSAWRTIECGIRLLGSWPVAFDGFIRSNQVSDVTMLLMISSMIRQTAHLVAHPTKRNWLMMEMNGVYTFSALFDEIKSAEANRRIATAHLLRELSAQIMPDGMHNELSPDYHNVVFNCAANFYSVAVSLGCESEVPEVFKDLIKSTVNAAVNLSTPALIQPLTNDCHNIPTRSFTHRAESLFGAHPEWSFISSGRTDGSAPSGKTASRLLNYAGFAVMRNDWSADSSYLCFDVGPLGAAHAHQDKLNIIVYKGDEELICDDGGGMYDLSEFRQYAKSGYDHNTVLVDGLSQYREEPLQVTEPIDAQWTSSSTFDYACGVYDDTFGKEAISPAIHKREVRFCKPDFFCVNDTLTSRDGDEHDYEILFQLNTTRVDTLEGYKNAVISDFGKKYDVAIIPLDCESTEASLKIISGQTEPTLRGWYNGRNETDRHKATTVSREVKNVKDHRFTTLIFPVKNREELPKVEKVSVEKIKIYFKGSEYELNINELDK